MAQIVYILCAATSLLCTIMLVNGYRRTRAKLLLWSGLCFLFLSINNVLLFVDLVLFREVELSLAGISFAVLRSISALVGLSLLVFGLIWDSK